MLAMQNVSDHARSEGFTNTSTTSMASNKETKVGEGKKDEECRREDDRVKESKVRWVKFK
jgi:hypothetical protein